MGSRYTGSGRGAWRDAAARRRPKMGVTEARFAALDSAFRGRFCPDAPHAVGIHPQRLDGSRIPGYVEKRQTRAAAPRRAPVFVVGGEVPSFGRATADPATGARSGNLMQTGVTWSGHVGSDLARVAVDAGFDVAGTNCRGPA